MKTGHQTCHFDLTKKSAVWSRRCQSVSHRVRRRMHGSTFLIEQLPPLYADLLPKEFSETSVREEIATCSKCRMCEGGTGTYKSSQAPVGGSAAPFLSSTKCCTYYPFVANYLVGGALASDPNADHPFRILLRDRQWVLPIGVVAPPSYQKRHREKKAEEFGRNADLVCPFYVSSKGHCGIWQWRDSECTTYFCESSYGKMGEVFWREVAEFLFQTEMLLSQDCMLEKGFSSQEIDGVLKFIKSNGEARPYSLSALEWNEFWQHQSLKVEKYFVECYEMVLDRKPQYRSDILRLYRQFGDRLKWNPTNNNP